MRGADIDGDQWKVEMHVDGKSMIVKSDQPTDNERLNSIVLDVQRLRGGRVELRLLVTTGALDTYNMHASVGGNLPAVAGMAFAATGRLENGPPLGPPLDAAA